MATDVERLIVTLEASTKQYERALLKAQGTTKSAMLKIERDLAASATRQQALWAKAGGGIETTLRRSLVGPMAALAGAFGGRELIGFADSFKRIENAMKVAGLEGENLTATMESLFAISSKNGAPVEALAQLYGRVALAQKELNVSSAEMISFTDNVAAALRVSGRSAEEARGALLQLSQAIGSGIVRGEEFNAILEGALPIAQAAARGLEEAGGSVAKLRLLILDGKVSSEAFFRAFQAGAVETQRQAGQAELTISQAWTNIQTAFIEAVGSIDKTTGASSALTTEMASLARGIKATADELKAIVSLGSGVVDFFSNLDAGLRTFGEDIGLADSIGDELEKARALLTAYRQELAIATAEGNAAGVIANERMVRAMIDKINQLDPGPAFERMGRQGAATFEKEFIKTVSLADLSIKGPTVVPSGSTSIGGAGTHTVPAAGGGTVPVRVTGPVALNPVGMETAVRSGVSDLRTGLIDLRTGLVQSVDGVGSGVRDLRTGLTTISGSVDSSAENITSAIGRQTGTLQSAFQKLNPNGPGIESGDVFSVAVASERTLLGNAFKGFEAGVQQRTDALSAEAQVLQTGLQYKQLTDKQRSEAELRLAEIEIEQAKLQENLAQATVNLTSGMERLSNQLLDMNSFEATEAWQNAREAGKQMAQAGDAFNAFISTLRLMAGVAKFAEGGHVRGPGGPTSDMVPIMASSGEFVVNAKQARKYRDLLEAINAGSMRMFADGGLVGRANAAAQRMANGGMVRAAPVASIGSRDININMTVVAQDAQTFKGSQRDMIRQMAREIRSADI